MKDAYELDDCEEAVPFDQLEDNVYNEIMLMINVDTHSMIALFEAEMQLLEKFKGDEAKLYTDGSAESDGEEEEPQNEQ